MGPNEKILRDAYARYGTGVIEAILDMFADNIVWKSSGAPNRLSFAGEYRGIAGIRDYFAAQREEWTLIEHKLLDVIADGDHRFVARVLVEAKGGDGGDIGVHHVERRNARAETAMSRSLDDRTTAPSGP